MKSVYDMTRKELLALSHRKWDDSLKRYDGLLVLARGKQHASGWGMIVLIGIASNKEPEIAAATADDICWHLEGQGLRTDCLVPSRAMHFWGGKGKFRVGHALSSTDVYVYA